jgi:hypothetical protein
MWGASLFFITILFVTSSGRDVLEAYFSQTIGRFMAQSPYSDVSLALMAVLALVLALMMRSQRQPVKPDVYVILREIHGPLSPANSRSYLVQRTPLSRRQKIGILLRRLLGMEQKLVLQTEQPNPPRRTVAAHIA